MFLRTFLKNLFYLFLNFLSLLAPHKKVAVLMYHSVGDNSLFFTVKPKDFAWQMAYLRKKKYQVIDLARLVGWLAEGKPLPDKIAVLTFDDGYEDNYFQAFPILRKHNFPATIFLTTGFLGQTMNNFQNKPLKLLSWPQIKEMHHSGLIDFEPHTISHQPLTDLPLAKAGQEILLSKDEVEKTLQKKCSLFSYPKGKYNEAIKKVLQQSGFLGATSENEGLIKQGADLLELKRNSIDSTTNHWEFRGSLSLASDWFNYFYRLKQKIC